MKTTTTDPSSGVPLSARQRCASLLAQAGPIEALHYRQWYDLLVNAGFRVAGKDPLAVFLTQLSRSPLVRKASAPGVYEVDHQAPRRIRHRLDRLQIELREVTVAAPGPIELGEVRARRHELDLAISQQERALEEALRVLASSEAKSGPGRGTPADAQEVVTPSAAAPCTRAIILDSTDQRTRHRSADCHSGC